ncbi:hypothetical protein HYFRA_00008896 [Hymenoscyphus fraxineus]|uniref:Uncharacterized protein n=1 Tax=Hymenoscyphus fraxineus TaxID=746836 RepID=A0A9N9L1M0_9HELO|nr:hypothetical protein HYFRA_00008896 [Hymenoscyphus fraxineus]
MKNIFSFALLAAAVSASPSPKDGPSGSCKSTQNANFDDLTGVPAVQYNQIPVPYKGLKYQGFNFLVVVKTGVAPGVVPRSGNNYGVSNAVTRTTGGSPRWTADYPNSAVRRFTPLSFYYGCSIDLQNGVAAAPTACDITIIGYKEGDKRVASQTFAFRPASALSVAQMTKGNFGGSFQEVQYVTVSYTIAPGSPLNANLVLLVDDIQYATCSSGGGRDN